jgi:hypothetical protein
MVEESSRITTAGNEEGNEAEADQHQVHYGVAVLYAESIEHLVCEVEAQ